MLDKLVRYTLARTPVGSVSGRNRVVQQAYKRRIWSKPRQLNQFFGVYPSFAEAQAAIPDHLVHGWDDDAVVAGDFFQPSLFAALFWLSRILKPGDCVIDFGGAVGQTHRALSERMNLPADVLWTVVDVDAAVRRGAELAVARGTRGLNFCNRVDAVEACDIFMSRGCLQYVETPLISLLASLPARPRYLLLDKIPLIEGPQFVTLQNLMRSAAPYQVFNRTAFLASLLELGYAIRDEWPVQELSCAIPFHPERFVAAHTGLLLELQAASC